MFWSQSKRDLERLVTQEQTTFMEAVLNDKDAEAQAAQDRLKELRAELKRR